jgi:catechol 2,3-dioxygenase-like lactoylglutathione lyase family enzyme
MKRFHVHVHVVDLEKTVRFYSALFGAEPAVLKPDYAKWMLEDPRLNFAVSRGASASGIGHLGLQVDRAEELVEIAARGQAAELGGAEELEARCCYAQSNKHWFTDPQGVVWETFESYGAIDTYGEDGSAHVEPMSACGGSSCCP